MFSMQRLRNTDISVVVLLLLTLRHDHCMTLSYVRVCSYSQEICLLCPSYSQDFTATWDLLVVRESCILVFSVHALN
jgi:hypothetical protein